MVKLHLCAQRVLKYDNDVLRMEELISIIIAGNDCSCLEPPSRNLHLDMVYVFYLYFFMQTELDSRAFSRLSVSVRLRFGSMFGKLV